MPENIIDYYARKFGEYVIPPDLFALLHMDMEKQAGHVAGDPLSLCEAQLLGPSVTHLLISHDYLNDQDKANPDIMDNVNAMNDTAEHMVFAMATIEGVLGYWLKDNPDTPQIFMLDTEGQYQIASGDSLTECLCYDLILGHDKPAFDEAVRAFHRYGIHIEAKTQEEIFAGMDAREAATVQTPQQFRSERYNFYRQKRGEPPI